MDELVHHPVDPQSLVVSAVGYRVHADRPTLHRGLPSPWLTLIVTIDSPVVEPDQGTSLDMLVGGLHLTPAMVEMPRVQTGIQLALDPFAARSLLGVPAAEIAHGSFDLADVVPQATALRDAVGSADDWPARFAALRRAAGRWSERRASAPRAEVAAAWSHLLDRRGAVRIDDLARHVHLSPRQLSTLFRRELGVTPKQAARIMRFTHAHARISAATRDGVPARLADVAADCGYVDQAHLAHEFADLTGTSPTAWLDEERRNLQAGGHSHTAHWAS